MKTSLKYTHWFVLSAVTIVLLVYLYAFNNILHCEYKFIIGAGSSGIVLFCLTAWCTSLVIRVYPTTVAVILYALFIATIFSFIAGYTYWRILQWMGAEMGTDLKSSYQTIFLLLIITGIVNNWFATYLALNKKNKALEKKLVLHSDASVLVREAELFKLRQQLQPHFLYNSLNSISALMTINHEKAQDMIGKLSDFLRSSVKRETEDRIPLQDELEYIQSYLDIETMRFGDRLQVRFQHEATDNATLPPFLLQPILENAIKYGIYGTTGNVTISISIKQENNLLIFTVNNPYDADVQPNRGTGFGLGSIRRRLYLLYARNDLLETIKDNHYFTTILKIPQNV